MPDSVPGDCPGCPAILHRPLATVYWLPITGLTSREHEVLTCVAEGLSNKDIARRFNIGTRTAETHRDRLMRKLGSHSIAGLTRFAIAKGLVPMPDLAATCP